MVTLRDQRVTSLFLVFFSDGRNVGAATATTGTRNADSIFCVCLYLLENMKR